MQSPCDRFGDQPRRARHTAAGRHGQISVIQPIAGQAQQNGLMFLATLSYCGHNLRHWWGWAPCKTVDCLDGRLPLLLNLDRTAAETLKATQGGCKRNPPESELQQLQFKFGAAIRVRAGSACNRPAPPSTSLQPCGPG